MQRGKNLWKLALYLVSSILVVVVIDQWTKDIIVHSFVLGESLPVWGDFLRLSLVHNYGVAFGVFNQASEAQHYTLTTVNILILSALSVFWLTQPIDRLARVGVGLIICGGVGNIIDRFRYGYVIDFIDVGIQSYRWPVFNVADSCVSVGITLWLIAILLAGKNMSVKSALPKN